MASIKVKQISSSCKTRMRVTISVYEKYANQCLRKHSAHGVLCVYKKRKRAVHACRKNLWIPASISWRLFAHFGTRKHAASVGLIHARMNASAGLSDAYITLSLLSRMFPCCKSRAILVPAPATGHRGQCYHCRRTFNFVVFKRS